MAGAADTLPPPADPIAEGAFCDGAPNDNPFTDLGAESSSTREVILCLVATGLTEGTTPTTYTPGGPVTRRQMALFIKRLADLFIENESGDPDVLDLTALPAYDGTPDYPDVVLEDAAFREAIGQLTQANIVGGFPDGEFRPNEPVSRRQMAAFINRLRDFMVGEPYEAGNSDFFDDDNGDSGEENLNALASVGIFLGDGQGNVNPGGTLSRRQMANILLRNAQVHFALGLINSPFQEEPPPPAGNQAFTVDPGDDQNVETGTVQTFTVTGITSDTVDIQLVSCANVTNTDGTVTFPNSSNPGGTGNVATPGSVGAAGITVVNGAAMTSAQRANDVAVTNGSVSFTVSGGAAGDCYAAIVFDDADDDNNIDLGTNNQPSEDFGSSGEVQVVSAEANEGAVGANPTISLVNTGADLFSAGGETYFYDSNDEFRIRNASNVCTATTMAAFEQALSVGDVLDSTTFYRTTPTASSVFCIGDDAPAAPTGVAVGAPTGVDAGKAGLEVTFNDSATSSVASYTIFRATATQPAIVGQPITCPTVASGAFTQVGTVANTAAAMTYRFYDATATVPAPGTPQNPSYCYYVTATDTGGDVSVPSSIAGPAAASPATAQPAFTAATVANPTTITLTYNGPINPATVAANGSDFTVTSTTGGVSTNVVPTAAVGSGSSVTLTVPALQPHETLVITAKTGSDANTVCATGSTTNCQAVGNAVQATANAANPAITAASISGNTLTLTYGEAVFCPNSAGSQGAFAYDADGVAGGAVSPTAVTCNGSSTVVLTFAAGTLTGDAADSLTYTDPAGTADDVRDVQGGSAGTQTVSPTLAP